MSIEKDHLCNLEDAQLLYNNLRAEKTRFIRLLSTDNTWAKIWAKISTMEAGEVANIYIHNTPFSIITSNARTSGTPTGIIFRADEDIFQFFVKATTNNIICCKLEGSSSSSAGTYSEYVYAYSNLQKLASYTGTSAIEDLHTINYGYWGRATFKASVSPTGSDLTMNYICMGSSSNYKTIIAFSLTDMYMNTSYGSGGTWQGWKHMIPNVQFVLSNNDTFTIANDSRMRIDFCGSVDGRCGSAVIYTQSNGTIRHNKQGASSLTFDVSTANKLTISGVSGTVIMYCNVYAGSITKDVTT